MQKYILSILLFISNAYAFASNNIAQIEADRAYSTNNLGKLNNLYKLNPQDPVITYLNAKINLLNKNAPSYAEDFVKRMPDGYMKNDILHQLLIFYYNNDSFANYKNSYNALNNTQISSNETCGFDIANFKLNIKQKAITDLNWLTNNNITPWCAELGMLKYKNHEISSNALNRMLYNLVIYGDLSTFNKLAPQIKTKPINFNAYQNSSFSKLPQNPFILTYYISLRAKKTPDKAYDMLNAIAINPNSKSILANYIALQLALKQNFTDAISLFEKHSSNNLSNDIFEWKARSYLAKNNWNKLILTINNMPITLQEKNTWLYWMSQSYKNLNRPEQVALSLKKIPLDYSYYSMLAQSELQTAPIFNNTVLKKVTLEDTDFTDDIEFALHLYRLGKSNNCNTLVVIGTYQWFYLSRIATTQQLLQMSITARNSGYYDLSIAAANKINIRYTYLSFPKPYLSYYDEYSSKNGISSAYALAVSRQESRFNATSVAFDGGQGLMQIMPQTAKYIFKKANYAPCSRINYECNIKIGTWYLGNLFSKFGSFIYASAGYNAGPNRANRWQKNLSGLDNRIQIELIPIQITRDYVQKVLINKAIYDNLDQTTGINLLQFITTLSDSPHNMNILDDDTTDADKL